MTPDERDLIAGLYDRLRSADTADKDREAEDLIRRQVTAFPAAPYLLTQTVLVQEQALKGAETRIAELEQQLADARRAGQAAAPAAGGSFLNRVRRPWDTQAAPQPPAPAYQPQPQGYAPQPAYAAPSGGGFLQGALSTAAGVAGGALLFQGVERLLGHGGGGPFGGYTSGSPWGGNAMPVEENVTVNNYYGSDQAPEQHHAHQQTAADTQQVDYVDDGSSAFSDDDGGSYDV